MARSRPSDFLRAAAAFSVVASSTPALAATYHVAASGGADANDGSAAHPFATLSACASLAKAGDTCTTHAGTYRETVTLRASGTATAPIRFEVAAGECVTVTGADPFTAPFTNLQGDVWSAPVTGDIQQMFSNGAMIWEAQWPNRTPSVVFDVPKGITAQGTGVQTVDDGSATYLVDPNIPAGDWTGAMVFILPGSRWQSDSRAVSAYDPATHTLTLDTTVPWAEKSTQPIPSNQYYLYGSPLALDAQDEWVVSKGNLLYYSSDDPGKHGLEAKTRPYAFDITGSYVEIVGFHVFGAAVRATGDHNTIDSLSIEYPTHLRSFNAYYTEGDINRITGDFNVWKNSIIQKSGSSGLGVAGNQNRIENNIVTDAVYQATNRGALDVNDWQKSYQGNLFLYNTVTRSGRAGIFQAGAANGRVMFNKVSHWALLTNDMGGIYSWGTDGQGGEIAYNELSDVTAFWANGIYLDDKVKHFIAHHNYVHDSTFYAFNIKEENEYFNNTMANVGTPFQIGKNFQTGQWEHTDLAQVKNNLTDGTLLVRVGILPTNVAADFSYFEAQVHATADWQHVVIPFASMGQPLWFTQVPFDLTAVHQIAFTPSTNGDFQMDLDNIRLEGATSLVVDDFESASALNGLGGSPWGGGAGDGVSLTSGNLTFATGGPGTSTKYASFTGSMVFGDSSWGLFNESVPDKDLSSYTAISFDIRGGIKDFKVLASGGSPLQSHNATCSFLGSTVPSCALDQGAVLAGVTDGFGGAAPDIGAFESTSPPWVAGAVRSADSSICGKIADMAYTLPPRAPNPWQDAGAVDAGATMDAGPADASADGSADASLPDGTSVSPAGGCGCRVAGDSTRTNPLAIVLGAMAVAALRRGRLAKSRAHLRSAS